MRDEPPRDTVSLLTNDTVSAADRPVDPARSEAARRAALDLTELLDPSSERESAGFLILDEAILRLAKVDPEAAAVVRRRCFAGLGIDETAAAPGVRPGLARGTHRQRFPLTA